MHVTELALTDFRSYPEVELKFQLGVNVLIGINGQGKTNVVEAIHYLSALASHRVASDAPLVRRGAESARVRLVVNEGPTAGPNPREIQLEVEIVPGRANRAWQNSSPLSRPRDLLGTLQTVVFSPEDLMLVKGDPSDRRRFLDETLIQLTPAFAGVRADLDRILKQRNALLKSTHDRNDVDALRTLDVWDGQLAKIGSQVLAARIRLVDELLPRAADAYLRVSNDRGPLQVRYENSIGVESVADTDLLEAALLSALADKRREEIDRGVTLVGPQRDELGLQLRGMPVRGYASHGESWSVALALRLGVFDLLRSRSMHGDPVLILDDVFAELDEVRRRRLVEQIEGAEQTIITAAVADDVPEELSGALFDVFDGEVTRVA